MALANKVVCPCNSSMFMISSKTELRCFKCGLVGTISDFLKARQVVNLERKKSIVCRGICNEYC